MTNDVETKIRAALASREIDQHTTAEVAALVGCSAAAALRVLNKLHDGGFVADDGSELCRNEIEAGRARPGDVNPRAPKHFVWFFC